MKKIAIIFCLSFLLPTYSYAINSDQELVNRIEESLNSVPLSAHEFEIASRFGNITLNGYVSSNADKDRVEAFVANIEGVNKLNSKLKVKDTRASANLAGGNTHCPIFKTPPLKSKGEVTFLCQGDTITVNGVVGSSEDRIRLKDAIAASNPDANIVMNAEIAGRPSDEALQATLDQALAKEGRISENVTYFVEDGIAYFRGSVSHHTEIDAMLATANMIDGLRDVRSDVRVGD